MKKAIVLLLALASLQSFADERFPRPDRPGNGPGGRIDFPQCLKELDRVTRQADDLQNQLNLCLINNRNPGHGPVNGREVEELRRENRRLNDSIDRLTSDNRNLSDSNARLSYDNNALTDSNNRLLRENIDLRRQLDDLQGGGGRDRGFFSYAGCTDAYGTVDVKYIAAATGMFQLEAETNALKAVQAERKCTYGVKTVETEEIRTGIERNYCTAGCTDAYGSVDTRYIQAGKGRNMAEAKFNALKSAQKTYSCTYSVKIQNCQ